MYSSLDDGRTSTIDVLVACGITQFEGPYVAQIPENMIQNLEIMVSSKLTLL